MPSASASLQKAVFSALNASTSLTDLLAGSHLRRYATASRASLRDVRTIQERGWSTGSESRSAAHPAFSTSGRGTPDAVRRRRSSGLFAMHFTIGR